MHKIRGEWIRGSRVSSQQDPWIQIGSGPNDPDLGQPAPASSIEEPICRYICQRGSASPSGEPMCVVKDSVTISYSITRVDGLGGDEDG
eukprot:scaffold59798_cov27-Phaeocystis_antarctica.AAC.1